MLGRQPIIDQLRIVTFNIQDGGHQRENLDFNVLADLQPDILFLQEVIHSSPVREWATQLGMESITANGNTFRRVAIFSRHPIYSWHSHTPVPKLCRDFLSATIELQRGKLLNVFCVHLAAQPFSLFELLRLIEIKAVLRQAAQQSTVPCLIAGDFNAVGLTDKPIIS